MTTSDIRELSERLHALTHPEEQVADVLAFHNMRKQRMANDAQYRNALGSLEHLVAFAELKEKSFFRYFMYEDPKHVEMRDWLMAGLEEHVTGHQILDDGSINLECAGLGIGVSLTYDKHPDTGTAYAERYTGYMLDVVPGEVVLTNTPPTAIQPLGSLALR